MLSRREKNGAQATTRERRGSGPTRHPVRVHAASTVTWPGVRERAMTFRSAGPFSMPGKNVEITYTGLMRGPCEKNAWAAFRQRTRPTLRHPVVFQVRVAPLPPDVVTGYGFGSSHLGLLLASRTGCGCRTRWPRHRT